MKLLKCDSIYFSIQDSRHIYASECMLQLYILQLKTTIEITFYVDQGSVTFYEWWVHKILILNGASPRRDSGGSCSIPPPS